MSLHLKTLGLYLYTLIIGHKYCNMLSILNKLTLQKEKQNVVTNNVFLDKKVKTQQQQNKKSNIKKPMSEPGIEPGTFKRKRYHCTTEFTDSIHYTQAM